MVLYEAAPCRTGVGVTSCCPARTMLPALCRFEQVLQVPQCCSYSFVVPGASEPERRNVSGIAQILW